MGIHDFLKNISDIVLMVWKLSWMSFLVKTVTPPLPKKAEVEDTME